MHVVACSDTDRTRIAFPICSTDIWSARSTMLFVGRIWSRRCHGVTGKVGEREVLLRRNIWVSYSNYIVFLSDRGFHVVHVSPDKDMLQLISPNVHVMKLKERYNWIYVCSALCDSLVLLGRKLLNSDDVQEKYGLRPEVRMRSHNHHLMCSLSLLYSRTASVWFLRPVWRPGR